MLFTTEIFTELGSSGLRTTAPITSRKVAVFLIVLVLVYNCIHMIIYKTCREPSDVIVRGELRLNSDTEQSSDVPPCISNEFSCSDFLALDFRTIVSSHPIQIHRLL
jgi:hypothetical protein